MICDSSELISVIVPVYNIEEFLPRCLECIYMQSYKNLEIILVDDGSTESSGLICDSFAARDSRAKVIHQKNKGVWAARNTGFEASTGEYLWFPDGDDFFRHDILEQLYKAINKDWSYDLALSGWKKDCIEEDRSSTFSTEATRCHILEKTRDDLIRGLFSKVENRATITVVWNKLYRRKVIADIRYREYIRAEDYDFNLRVFMQVDKAVLIDNDLYYWVQRSGSLTGQKKHAELANMCRVRSLYLNYINISVDNVIYGRYLLSRLYKEMVFWKARAVGDNHRTAVFLECKSYVRSTRKVYFLCGRIPLYEKIGVFTLFSCPHMTHLLMKVTKNL
jgi:glycosyltransferase involved in cell wall biosynthesis